MSIETKIEWTHWPDGLPGRTWNPTRGCSRVSDGCRNCYAERQAARFCKPDSGGMTDLGYEPNGDQGPFYGFARMSKDGPRWTGRVELIKDKLFDPLRARKPARWFVNSMSDLFHESLHEPEIRAVFSVMALPQSRKHRFLILTKRARRMRELLSQWQRDGLTLREGCGAVLPNVALGVSVEDQATADERIPELLATPAALRFVSYEPALGPVDFERFVCDISGDGEPLGPRVAGEGLDWIIVGGESGPRARPFDLAWARSVIELCREADVPCYVKQLGSYWAGRAGASRVVRAGPNRARSVPRNSKGGDPLEWSAELRVREFPALRAAPRPGNFPPAALSRGESSRDRPRCDSAGQTSGVGGTSIGAGGVSP